MDLRKLKQQHIASGKESNISIDASLGGSDGYDVRKIPAYGVQKKRGKTQLNTPIQPIYKSDPRYNESKKPYNDRFSRKNNIV